ncbi:MAG TPA: EAL domain-containing protein [Polyangiales bacterium]|nr:EAL domain-containing protein [Polyangiales bacterium]
MQESEAIGAGLRLIVVEDEAVVRLYLEAALSELGFAVEMFGTLREGRERTRRGGFEILLADKNLPDGSGLELCTELAREDGSYKLLVMSGYANLASAVEAIKHGIADYLVKPLELDDLRARLTRVVNVIRLERKNAELVAQLRLRNAELENLAVRDPLTGLFNHGYLHEALAREIARSELHGRNFALALLDIDGFSEFNRTHGHAIGDGLLRELGLALQCGGQSNVAEQEIAARFGPDVFALILPEVDRATAATKLENVRRSAAQLPIAGDNVPTLSIGFAVYPADAQDREALVACAQGALGAAKRVGGDQLVSYSEDVGSGDELAAARSAARARALTRSLATGSFGFVYQPIVHARERNLFAYEALCRPQDAAFANVGELIETAVRTGRINDLGRVLRRLAAQPLETLPDSISLFINIHPQDLSDDVFCAVEPHLARWAHRIVFEVTETEAIVDPAWAHERIQNVRARGFRVALDDLGSGYSGLNMLAELQPDIVKLDMKLVRAVRQEGRVARLVKHVIEYCKGEQLLTIAEGIETEPELDTVTQLGVDYVQGFLLGRPEPLVVSGS